MKRWLYTSLGVFFVILGGIGIILPLLPTTPFLLLASACFLRGSDKFSRWLHSHSLFGPMISDWHEHRAVARSTKRWGLVVITVSFAVSIWLVANLWLQAFLVLLYLVLICGFIRLPTLEFVANKRENI
ncbi:YbaN family protein [Vibrio sp. S4M6]|uniref:YbaN family protein n=1 Tax=Vibrio sinus TaxID=2946865 RepID=UPI002029C079|nr:YbaN family protein [Vibrio sinus]